MLVVDRGSRDEAFRRLGVKQDVPLTRGSLMELAAGADATIVISGEFTVTAGTPEQIHLTASVIHVRQMRRLGDCTESGALDDLWRLQARIVWEVLKTLSPHLAGDEETFLAARPSIRLDAMESYVRALRADSAELRHKLLSQATRLQPDYSQANFELGKYQYSRKEYAAAIEALKRVNPRDAHHREALFFLGLSYFDSNDFPAAEDALARVAAEVPLPEVFNNLGAAQLQEGKAEAIDSFKQAVEGDPADPDYQFNTGYALWRAGRFDEAADYFRAALERSPNDHEATLLLGRCLKKAGPRPGELGTEGLVLLKSRFNESAWLQLKAFTQKR